MASPLPESIIRKSASDRELVLSEFDALEALRALQEGGHRILGWEGWLRSPTGQLGQSGIHQGTADLSSLSQKDAYTLCRRTIQEAAQGFQAHLEKPGHELLFCIAYS